MLQGYTVDLLSAIFLICFGIGLLTSLGALLLGGHGDPGSGHGGEVSHGALHGGDPGQGAVHSGGGGSGSGVPIGTDGFAPGSGSHAGSFHVDSSHAQGSQQVPILNLNTFLGFLLGFGAAGFVVKQVVDEISPLLNLLLASLGGLAFGYVIYLVLAKILVRGQSAYLRASDFSLIGMEGTVSSTIFTEHLGEISYILNHSNAFMPARERDGREIKKGQPVVVMEVKNGVAIVLPIEEFRQHASE
ncbi:MAG: NfeD family protein [Desulfitobacteriaceae bacterium]